MKKLLSLIFTASLIISCGSSHVITSKKEHKGYQPKKTTPKGIEIVTQNDSNTPKTTQPLVNTVPKTFTNKVEKYIYKYKNIAQYEMQQHGVPASITLAQGILESGAGQGDLTQRANNHFGIKCHNWKGEKVYHDDDKKGECFRKYTNPADSFRDHSLFLSGRNRYASLFKLKPTNYKGWAKGLRKAGYATDSKYPKKLISIIERYKLYQYDTVSKINIPTNTKSYTVQQGDSLYNIAKKFNTSVAKIKKINHLTDNNINVGQQLNIQ